MLNFIGKIIGIIVALSFAAYGGSLINGAAKMDTKGADVAQFYWTALSIPAAIIIITLVAIYARRKGAMSPAVVTTMGYLGAAVIGAVIATVIMGGLNKLAMTPQLWGFVVGGLFGLACLIGMATISRKPVESSASS